MTRKINHTGETTINNFGSKMTITEYRKYNDIDVYFPEYNWTGKNMSYKHFKKGNIECPYEPRLYNIGYIGEGLYKTNYDNEYTKAYIIWSDMLRRCYSPTYQEKYPSYIDCEVCDKWKNFQAFAKWYEDNYYEEGIYGMCISKDILIKGNKIYSPDTCIFVSRFINNLLTESDAKKGVCYKNNKYLAQCNISGSYSYIGSYDTPEEAFQAYKETKEYIVYHTAEELKEYIPEQLYEAMYNYQVEIDN